MVPERVLRLTLKRLPFEVMASGEKLEEFRDVGSWIESRLFDRSGNRRIYDAIEYTNGYGADRPRFITDFEGFSISQEIVHREYSNGLIVHCEEPVWVIKHTKVLEVENYRV